MLQNKKVMSVDEFFNCCEKRKEEHESKTNKSIVISVGGAGVGVYGFCKYVAITLGLVKASSTLPIIMTVAGAVGVGYGIANVVDSHYKIAACDDAKKFVYENGVPASIKNEEDTNGYIDTLANKRRADITEYRKEMRYRRR